MSRLVFCACLLSVCSVACQDAARPPATPAAPAVGGDQIAWQGMLACADCDGIQTELVLSRAGEGRRYTLTENYVTGSNGVRFTERGGWQRSAGLLRLHGDGSSLRVYALMSDGRLQPRDSHGARLPGSTDHELLPVGFSTTE